MENELSPKAVEVAQRLLDIPWHYEAKPDEWKRYAAQIIQSEVQQIVKIALDGAIHASKGEGIPPHLEQLLKGWFPEKVGASNV